MENIYSYVDIRLRNVDINKHFYLVIETLRLEGKYFFQFKLHEIFTQDDIETDVEKRCKHLTWEINSENFMISETHKSKNIYAKKCFFISMNQVIDKEHDLLNKNISTIFKVLFF